MGSYLIVVAERYAGFAERVDDRRVLSGIMHVLHSGCHWSHCPREYGPPKTIYNRFVRWARRGIWERIFVTLAGREGAADQLLIETRR